MKSFLKNNIVSISFGTLLSKLAGFTRQICIAAAFGIGTAYDAYNYAYIIPGFLIIIIGGINGPLHNAIVTVLTPLNSEEASSVLNKVSIKITFLLFLIGLIIFLNANLLIENIGPNLNEETKIMATRQLKILSPCIPMSGFIGLSFGALNSKDKFFISSFSPGFISLITILFIAFNWLNNFQRKEVNNLFNPELLAIATLSGTMIQFIVQIFEISKIGLLKIKYIWGRALKDEKRIFKLIIPASIASGLGQINVFVDMFFLSSLKGAASGLAYGNFLIQAPLGILSNTLILPLLPKFSKLINNNANKELQKTLITGIEYCFLTTLFLAGLFLSFNTQIVELVFQRGAFDYQAVFTVKRILIAYAIGIPFYLYRDLLIRTYYSFEKTKLPFNLSIIGIILNIIFDWIMTGAQTKPFGNLFPYNFGVVGVVLSTGLVNLIICIILSVKLRINNVKLPNYILFKKITLISIASLISSFISSKVINNLYQLSFLGKLKLPVLIFCCLIFLGIYFLITKLFNVNKFNFKSIFY